MLNTLTFSPSEGRLWDKQPKPPKERLSPDEIDAKYSSKEERIVTEMNREKLPNFIEALKKPNYMVLRPEYQRRQRWSEERQSLLIESFIMNIPVPPLFIYETKYNHYEVMDGQQRITAIQSFYENDLTLCGLDRWPELNGYTYKRLPPKVRSGIDRRSISYIVLLTESAATEEDAIVLKQLVFERLNTGGVRLSQQEVRNCLYQGKFNRLLLELSKEPKFRAAWKLPLYSEAELATPDERLLENAFYSRMQDMEVILRFFALRHFENYQRGMQGFLDLYMIRARDFNDEDLLFLAQLFTETVTLACNIYENLVFVPYDKKNGQWSKFPHVAFADAVLVGLCPYLEKGQNLITRRTEVIENTKALFVENPDGTFTGRGNTKKDVENRITLFRGMLSNFIS